MASSLSIGSLGGSSCKRREEYPWTLMWRACQRSPVVGLNLTLPTLCGVTCIKLPSAVHESGHKLTLQRLKCFQPNHGQFNAQSNRGSCESTPYQKHHPQKPLRRPAQLLRSIVFPLRRQIFLLCDLTWLRHILEVEYRWFT